MKSIVQANFTRLNWQRLHQLAQWAIDAAVNIQQIPAPTFHEEQRAAHVHAIFQAFQLQQVEVDTQRNVYGLLPGSNPNLPGVMVSAHTDTVFAAETDLTIRQERNRIYGPGLGDNSVGVAGMVSLLKYLHDERIQPACNIWFVATSGEEGLGDLNGMRAAYAKLQQKIGMVVNLEGLAIGHVYNAGIAVHRLQITATADGGHSWLHFGRASAVHGIVELGARITQIKPPETPRTTYNIGMIDGGQAINAIGTRASLWLDMRSESQAALEQLSTAVNDLIRLSTHSGLRFETKVVGDRPAGMISEQHPLVEGALEALHMIGINGSLQRGSTDGNIPLAAGCPAVTIGITRGANAHRLDEYIETEPIQQGLQQLIVLVLSAAQFQAAQG